jgi:hypothetical protein
MTKIDGVDGTLFKFLDRSANRPATRSVVDAVEVLAALHGGKVTADQVRRVSLAAARDSLVSSGKPHASADTVSALAYWGAACAASESPFMLAEDPRSKSKAVHYLASGAISASVASWMPFFPVGLRHGIAFGVAHLVGCVKEMADKLKGTGYNLHDIATDDRGARAALE